MARLPDPGRFQHGQSPYERPNGRFQCGRAALWRRPCAAGPGVDGRCGGISDCEPVRENDRWQCRRSPMAGGPCTSGPLPDGRCAHRHPPCAPLPTTRVLRGRLTVAAAILAIVVIALNWWPTAADDAETRGGTAMMDPGPLSHQHHAFTAEQGCVACHQAHDASAGAWLAETLRAPANGAAGCTDCHTFAGPATAAHNRNADGQGDIGCASCHVEHEGRRAQITRISDRQCASCHDEPFDSLAAHRDFGERFPHEAAGAIVFDHVRHFEYHFVDREEHANVAPETCTTCHLADDPGRRVPASGFEASCAACHEAGITASSQGELTLLSLPQMRLRERELEAFRHCGATPGEKFRPAGRGKASDFMVWLLGVDERKPAFNRAVCDLVADLAKRGPAVLADGIEANGLDLDARLFAGLGLETMQQLGLAWAANERYRPPSYKMPGDAEENGWYIDRRGDMKYRPVAHADPVMRAWIELGAALQNRSVAAGERDDATDDFIDSLLSPEDGAGTCMKCHTLSTGEDDRVAVNWRFAAEPDRNRFVFRHASHLRLVDAAGNRLVETDSGCGVCHRPDPEAAYRDSIQSPDAGPYQSNFSAIDRETCTTCHNEDGVRNDCRLCHQYHDGAAFTGAVSQMMGDAKDE